jgi:hypothetical protein
MATQDGTAAPPESAQPAQKEVSPQATPPKQPEPERLQSLRVYGHSNFFYWWIVWSYGFVCALVTYFSGHKVELADNVKEVYVAEYAWVGISFVAVLLIVAFFTNYRLKGSASFIAILIIAVASLIMYILHWWEIVFRIFPALLIYMNLAFYIAMSSVLMVLWLLATFALDSLTYWEFTPGQVTKHQLLGEGAESYDAHGLHIDRIADDILINKILGLRWLGYGTADLKVMTAGAAARTFTIENVWQANRRDEQIRELAVVRPAVAP